MCIQNIASEQFSTETSNHVIISIYNRMQLHGHVFEKYQPVGFLTVGFFFCVSDHIPWEPEVFLACGGNFRCLAEGRHIFGRRPKPREKPLARSGAFYRSRWPLCFFIGLHLRQSDWKCPTVIVWAGTWRSVQRPTLSLAKQIRV